VVQRAHWRVESDQGVRDGPVEVVRCPDTFWDGGNMGSRTVQWPVVDLATGMESYHVLKRLKALTVIAHVQPRRSLASPVNILFVCFYIF
jgi:hypothetical protein